MLYRWMLRQGDLFIVEYDPLAVLLQVTNVVPATGILSNVADQTNQSILSITVVQWSRNFLSHIVWGISTCIDPQGCNSRVEIILNKEWIMLSIW